MKKLIVLIILVISGGCAQLPEPAWRRRITEMELLTTTTLSRLGNLKEELDTLEGKDADYRAKIELNKQTVREIAKDFNDVQIDACESHARAIDAYVNDKPNQRALNDASLDRMFELIDVKTVLKITEIYIEQAVLCSEIVSLQTRGKELIAKMHHIADEGKEKMDLLYWNSMKEQEMEEAAREQRQRTQKEFQLQQRLDDLNRRIDALEDIPPYFPDHRQTESERLRESWRQQGYP